MDIFCGVDGTGPYSDSEYSSSFANSFVNKMYLKWHTKCRYYDRGPGLDGTSTGLRANNMATFAERNFRSNSVSNTRDEGVRIFLTGYSRGGAAALEAANILASKDIPVYALLLFDAVDRSITISNTAVPSGVKYCRHAVRGNTTNSRNSFGHVGLRTSSNVDYPHAVSFHCTHGAMGGTPWKQAHTDGYIYEQENGAPKPNSISASPFMPSATATVLKAVFDRAYDAGSKTNVTMAQETKGTNQVETYMFNELMILKSRRPLYYQPTQSSVYA